MQPGMQRFARKGGRLKATSGTLALLPEIRGDIQARRARKRKRSGPGLIERVVSEEIEFDGR